MAKIIKCPKCGENVEIPPNAAGTVVKCGACGTGLRIKAKAGQPAGGGGGEQPDRGQGGMNGSMSGSISGSMSGTVIGQTGYGQPTPMDEPDPDGPPSLGSECAVCGKSVDPDDLVEDRGKLVCSKCAKRPAHRPGAAGSVAAIAPAPSFDPALRHGPMISISGAFLTGCAALIIVGACQAYLHFNPKPQGTRTLAAATTKPVKQGTAPTAVAQPQFPTATWEDQNRGEIIRRIEEARQMSGADPKGAIAKYDELLNGLVGERKIENEALKNMLDGARAERASLATNLANATPESTDGPKPAVANVPDPGVSPVTPDPNAPEQPQATEDPPKPANIFEPPPDTPELLQPVLMALFNKEYQDALKLIEQKKITAPRLPSRDQRLTLETLGAVFLGVGQYNRAEGQLSLAAKSYSSAGTKVTRSLVLNRAMAQLAAKKPPQETAKELMAYIQQAGGQPDETTHAVLGTAVSRIGPKVKERDELVNFLNGYTAQLDSTRSAEGKKRWGVNWADAKKVDEAQVYIARINEEIKKLEPELDTWFTARQNAGALGTKESLANANANYERVYGEIHTRKQSLLPYQPKWLEKFEPVMPEVAPEESSAPPPPVDATVAPPPPPVSEPTQPAPAPVPPPPPVP